MNKHWEGVVTSIFYFIQFERELDAEVVDRLTNALLASPCQGLTPSQEYDAIARGLLFNEPFPTLIPMRHSVEELHGFLSRIVRRMDERRPWPELAYSRASDSELPLFAAISPCALINQTVGQLQTQFAEVFSPASGGAYLLFRVRAGALIGLFAPPGLACAYAVVRGVYGDPEPYVRNLMQVGRISLESVKWLTPGDAIGDFQRVLEGKDTPQKAPWLTDTEDSMSAPTDPRLQREPVASEEEARELMRNVFGQGRKFWVLECTHGWVSQAILTDEEVAQGSGIGLGNYVLNKRTGAVTAHASLSPEQIGTEFDAAVEAGTRVAGHQVYPPLRRIHLQQTFENPQAIGYRVQVLLLDRLNDPETTQLLTITKNPVRHQPTGRISAMVASWAQMRSRTTGIWPSEGTIEC